MVAERHLILIAPPAEGICKVFAWLIVFESVRVQEAVVQADMDVA